VLPETSEKASTGTGRKILRRRDALRKHAGDVAEVRREKNNHWAMKAKSYSGSSSPCKSVRQKIGQRRAIEGA